jgi:glycosyltransferase involved in cell wall biosynthesis
MEDWFSEDLPREARKSRPLQLLHDCERKLLVGSLHATCPSRAMSNALSSEFACDPPAVVYNAFPWSDRSSIDGVLKDRIDRRDTSIHWFSQTLGPGRGLEDLFAALPLLNNKVEVHLRGNPSSGFENWLSNRVPKDWRNRIVVHTVVTGAELLSRIAEHDIGFAGEMKYCRNKDLTVSNKILQYLLAGLAVVASDTAGQREVAEQAPGGVHLYRSGDARDLAACIDGLLGTRDVLPRAKAAALEAAQRTFCWERQEATLLSSVERSLHSGSKTAGSVGLHRQHPAN